jgi:hypothetical protein
MDPHLLAWIWDIHGIGITNDKVYEKKTYEWPWLKWIGDGVLAGKTRIFLTELFGLHNYRLCKALVDHAKGNGFLVEVGKMYHMDKWVHQSPAHEKDKLWGDIMEVWFGAAELDRRIWTEPDCGSETELFLEALWKIRYQKICETLITSRREREPLPKDSDTDPFHFKVQEIGMPRSPAIMQLCGFTGSMNNRQVGYLVEASVEVNKEDASTFHTFMAKFLSSIKKVAQTLATDKLRRLLRG